MNIISEWSYRKIDQAILISESKNTIYDVYIVFFPSFYFVKLFFYSEHKLIGAFQILFIKILFCLNLICAIKFYYYFIHRSSNSKQLIYAMCKTSAWSKASYKLFVYNDACFILFACVPKTIDCILINLSIIR